jgi:hypothetical protein
MKIKQYLVFSVWCLPADDLWRVWFSQSKLRIPKSKMYWYLVFGVWCLVFGVFGPQGRILSILPILVNTGF